MLGLSILLLLGYLLGSFPTAIIVGKVYGGIDIRLHGSGNAGATNVYRVLGLKPALIVVSMDIFKGWVATLILPTLPLNFIVIIDIGMIQILTGLAAILGHAYTLFAKFKGGKGVATLTGMIIALFPIGVLVCLLVFILTLIGTGYVSVASIAASIILPFTIYFLPTFGFQPASSSLKYFALIIPLFVLYTHRSNIKRLLEGTENRFEKVMIWKKLK